MTQFFDSESVPLGDFFSASKGIPLFRGMPMLSRRDSQQNPSPMIFPCSALEVDVTEPLIQSTSSPNGISSLETNAYLTFIEQVLRGCLPEDLLINLSSNKDPQLTRETMLSLEASLPLIFWNDPQTVPCTLCFNLLCQARLASGVGRYIKDMLTRWLVPGKFLNISSGRSSTFCFTVHPDQEFFFNQILIDIDNDQYLSIARENQKNIDKELRLSIPAVRHARNIVSSKSLSLEQKKIIIEENIASVFDLNSKKFDYNVFDQMHNVMLHLNAEDKINKIQDQFTPYLKLRPKIFDRDIFQEIRLSMLMFGDSFTALRDLRHVSRLISYQYLFRKALMRMVISEPKERYLSLKLLPTHLLSSSNKKNVLGILGGMNILRDNELFEERHIMEAINHCLPFVSKIEHSFVLDRRSHDPVRLFYLEIEKKEGDGFSLKEIRDLKKALPHALKESIESVLHPLLMPRNEEEIMRNILLLNQELKYIKDLPQVVISFNAQTEQFLQFTVVLLRVLRNPILSIQEIFAKQNTILEVQEIEIKKVGLLRKRHPKEANVFKVSLNKKKFLRKDFTIDLFKARQAVSCELNRIFHGIRDFNGGIFSKQNEVFQELRALIKEPSSRKDFLLENFFYSLSPPLRQTLVPPLSLKTLFALLQDALEAQYEKESFFLKAQFESEQILVIAASPHALIKEEILWLITKLKILPSHLSSTYVNAQGLHCFGYIYSSHDQNTLNLFYSTLFTSLQDWQVRIKK